MTHSTKWNRMNINDALVKDFTHAKETMWLENVKPSKTSIGIQSTTDPNGKFTDKQMLNK
jgi:hypothetical protein